MPKNGFDVRTSILGSICLLGVEGARWKARDQTGMDLLNHEAARSSARDDFIHEAIVADLGSSRSFD